MSFQIEFTCFERRKSFRIVHLLEESEFNQDIVNFCFSGFYEITSFFIETLY